MQRRVSTWLAKHLSNSQERAAKPMLRHAPFRSHQKTAGPRTAPSSERGAEIDSGAIPDGVHEVVACNSEKRNEAKREWALCNTLDSSARRAPQRCGAPVIRPNTLVSRQKDREQVTTAQRDQIAHTVNFSTVAPVTGFRFNKPW